MFSNSAFLFEQLATTLYRAGMYVSFADLTGGEKAQRAEMYALFVLMQILQKQHSEDDFLHDLGKLAEGRLEGFDNLVGLPDKDIENIIDDLETTPHEVELAVLNVIDNFSKQEARLYVDLLISAGASVAQAHDEKDDFYFHDDGPLPPMADLISNFRQFYYRTLMFFNDLHQDDTARYLYDENSIFDQMKISGKESDALAKLSAAVRKAWLQKYPEDLKQTVQDYIEEQGH